MLTPMLVFFGIMQKWEAAAWKCCWAAQGDGLGIRSVARDKGTWGQRRWVWWCGICKEMIEMGRTISIICLLHIPVLWSWRWFCWWACFLFFFNNNNISNLIAFKLQLKMGFETVSEFRAALGVFYCSSSVWIQNCIQISLKYSEKKYMVKYCGSRNDYSLPNCRN